MRPIYIYNGTINIFTDLQICVLSVAMVWSVKTNSEAQAAVTALSNLRSDHEEHL